MSSDKHPDKALTEVEHQLKERLDFLRSGGRRFRRSMQFQVITLAVLSAATTLFVAFNQIYHINFLAIVSLVTAALMTVVTTVTSGSENQRLWLANTAAQVQLGALQNQISYDEALYGGSGSVPIEQIDEHHMQLQKIWVDHSRAWQEIHSTHESKPSSPDRDQPRLSLGPACPLRLYVAWPKLPEFASFLGQLKGLAFRLVEAFGNRSSQRRRQ
jgi:hypothetical protein